MIKSEYSVNTDLQRQVDDLKAEILSMVRDMKSREEAIQVAQVKIEVLESRAQVGNKNVETAAVQIKQEMQAEKERYEGIITELSGELAEFERELEELKLKSSASAPRTRQSSPRKSVDPLNINRPSPMMHTSTVSPLEMNYNEHVLDSDPLLEQEVF